MSQTPATPTSQPPLLQQAPVVPLDASGFTASLVGTALFALATLVCLAIRYQGFWLWVMLIGTALGLVLIAYTAWHKHRVHIRAARSQAPSVED